MMKKIKLKEMKLPTTSQLEKELVRVKYKYKYIKILKSTICTLIVVIALSILAATFLFSVLEIYGNSMSPNINEGDVVVGINDSELETGDVIAFYYNNRILVKRVVAVSSQWVDIDAEGNVFVDGKLIEEPYIDNKFYGEVDIEFPYQVPENSYFVLGDKRNLSIDSRNSLIGTISKNEIIGKVIFRVWPIKNFGTID